MKTKIFFGKNTQTKPEFSGDSLKNFYDYVTGEEGEVILDGKFVEKLFYKKIDDYFENKKIYQALIYMCKNYDSNTSPYNFYVDRFGNIFLGGLMRDLQADLEEYKEYLSIIEQIGLANKLEVKI